jgi:glutamyl-tRNA synthetase
MDKPRVRFAPSPTGYLHIGGARTALFNWLWARKTGGTFVLRVEDTDQERSTRESVQAIYDSMRWLGLDWDEGPEVGGAYGPYTQMQRLDTYREHAEKLIRAGVAYRCYCTPEELEAQRNKLPEKKRDRWVYPGTCRERTDEPDLPYVVRLKIPREGALTWADKVYGESTTPFHAMQDQVLMRSNGVPLYNFGAAVDDVVMDITLVARGRDHLINTPPQVLIYQGLGARVPEFAHLPMMLGPDGTKLSKRHGSVSVESYREDGWLPEALLNYISRFGWSHGDQEIFTRAQLVEHFDWAHVGAHDGRYDKKKAEWVSGEHLRMRDDPELARLVTPFLAKRGLTVAPDDPTLVAAVKTVRARASTLVQMADALDFYFRDELAMDAKAVEKFLTADATPRLRQIADVVGAITDWSEASVQSAMESWLAREGLEIKTVAQPARVALTGRAASPGLYEVIAVLGRERTVARLRRAADGASGTAA